jgi:hypothetical protein
MYDNWSQKNTQLLFRYFLFQRSDDEWNLYLVFGLTAITNESLAPGMWNLVEIDRKHTYIVRRARCSPEGSTEEERVALATDTQATMEWTVFYGVCSEATIEVFS